MRNPIAVLIFSMDHKSRTLNRILAKIGLYNAIQPYPFEHYCVFCAKYVSNEWWYPKEYFIEKQEDIRQILAEVRAKELI